MTLEELQGKLYDLLCLVDDICTKEGVRYFLDGGTEIGSVRDRARLDAVFAHYRPNIVFHAAAHKHVPLM